MLSVRSICKKWLSCTFEKTSGCSLLSLFHSQVSKYSRRFLGTALDVEDELDKDRPLFTGCRADYTDNLTFINPDLLPGIPIYRILDRNGAVVADGKDDPKLDRETLLKMYKLMVQLQKMDELLWEAHFQGRISFYMPHFGEEGVLFGSAAALNDRDFVWPQYREAGILMWRGFTLDQFYGQCVGNTSDYGKGRQMPVHYGSRRLNYLTVSSSVASQVCEASGFAYKLKMENLQKSHSDRRIAVCFFGDGGSSTGDFHAGMNFAATLACPVLYICRNNGYAISTPNHDQYRGDGVAARGPGYGMLTSRVDGNDPLAVYSAVKKARELILECHRPVLLEIMTYRLGSHTTSDDSTLYRPLEEIEFWAKHDNPIKRFRSYLFGKQFWTIEDEETWSKVARQNVLDAMSRADDLKKPSPMVMFDDVYDGSSEMPKLLHDQRESLRQHLLKYGEHYPLTEHTSFS